MASLSFGRHKVSTSSQAIVSRPDVPRSTFKTASTTKMTFDADYLYPFYVEEIIPGDSLSLDVTAFVRMSTPVFPLMDNLYVDTFFFFVPNRLVYTYWENLMAADSNDGDIPADVLVPQIVWPQDSAVESLSIYDYMGVPPITIQDIAGRTLAINALPLRAYDRIYDDWFRDQNLQATSDGDWGVGPDEPGWYRLRKRGKRHDYFTSALPWPQKGDAVSLPLSGNAPLVPVGMGIPTFSGPVPGASNPLVHTGGTGAGNVQLTSTDGDLSWADPALEVNLDDVLAVPVNTMRAAVAMQQLLERDGRFGTRYAESLKGHFGVDPQDYRLQRPEYLGGSSTMISVTPVAQTSAPPEEGDTPIGNLGAAAVATPRARINSTFPEHGYVLGIINVRADITYQQGLHRMWTRRTRFDFPFPIFANLGEQMIRQDEIFVTDDPTENEIVFGYQERYGEYRYRQSQVTSMFRSGITGTLDSWHLAEQFADAPVLDVEGMFIESNTPMSRVLAAGDLAEGQQFIADILFRQSFTRPLPVRGTPGLLRL